MKTTGGVVSSYRKVYTGMPLVWVTCLESQMYQWGTISQRQYQWVEINTGLRCSFSVKMSLKAVCWGTPPPPYDENI